MSRDVYILVSASGHYIRKSETIEPGQPTYFPYFMSSPDEASMFTDREAAENYLVKAQVRGAKVRVLDDVLREKEGSHPWARLKSILNRLRELTKGDPS